MTDTITRLNEALESRYTIQRELGEGGMATVPVPAYRLFEPGGDMSMRDPFVIVLLLTFGAAGEGRAQITDPIPARIEKRGLMVEIRDVARLPMTAGCVPPTRT